MIDTYDITFQHRPDRKHRNADALSRYPCWQCGGDCETPAKAVRAVTRSQRCEPGWTPEEMATRQDADPDIGPIMRWQRAGNDWPRWEDIHGGAIGAHLGTARTHALAEQGFYWPGMQVDVSRICNECDCTMLKKRRGRREPLHQYIVGVPMERLAMDVARPYPITSTGNQYCLMVGCYFSKWLECFPIPDQKATTVTRKLVYEIVARYGAFQELHSD